MSLKRLLIIGVGSIGERHARCFLKTGRVSVAICDNNDTLRNQVAQRYPVEAAYSNLDQALESGFDAAVICTPAHLHIPMATQLARAGIHLLIEKPLSTSPSGIDELVSVVRERGLKVGIAYVLRCHPALSAMREVLRSGRFGKPLQLVATSGQHFPTYRPAYREIYYADRARGGGAIQDALTHPLNAAEWLIGEITEVAADAAHQQLEGVTVEDTVHVLARHGEVLAAYTLNQYQAPNESTLTVVCEQGTLRFEFHQHRYRWMTTPGNDWQDESFGPLERDSLFMTQASYFLDTLDGAPPRCSLAEGIQTLRVNLAIIESAQARQWRNV